jgi:hypothetical protein
LRQQSLVHRDDWTIRLEILPRNTRASDDNAAALRRRLRGGGLAWARLRAVRGENAAARLLIGIRRLLRLG